MFIAYLEQEETGCDYTIDCGKELVRVGGSTFDEAAENLKNTILGEWDGRGYNGPYYTTQFRLARVTLYEVNSFAEMPVAALYQYAKEREQQAREDKERDERYQEYLRLREKFEEDIGED